MPHVVVDAGLLDVNGTLIAEVIAFLLMILILARWVYPPIMRAATEREKKIEAGVRAATEAEQRLKEVQEQVKATLDEARAQAREIVGRAHKDAVVEAQDVLAKAKRDAEAIIEKARIDIGAERDRALQDLRSQVANLVVEATSKVLAESIDPKAHQRLIADALAKVGASDSQNGGRSR
jgi:F-type H+-transporting ATPase subunit b